jgi:transcriptional regulator with XRE-family HTH domain
MEQRLGAAIRVVRRRRGIRQSDLARSAGVSTATVSRIERGHMAPLPFETTARVAAALDIRLDVVARWRGGELDRLLNAGHSAMHEQVARVFGRLPGWQVAPEVSFSIWGERGAIDVLAWHAGRRMLLVIELKTAIVDVQDLIATVDRKRRLAAKIASSRGWGTQVAGATTISAWVVLADTRTNRARLAAHVSVLRAAFPADGRTVRGWLPDPRRPISALSFLQIPSVEKRTSVRGGPQRVRIARSRGSRADPSVAKHEVSRQAPSPVPVSAQSPAGNRHTVP